ncbi:hypothetical protein [Algicola sagamiensis]|uniref:hypothetical protein n=1 Tax=Algicola sagamiensis TaxID=163869 RepID=UPI00036F4EB2|nr:hypothetical protein [Algicola sagamiensis]
MSKKEQETLNLYHKFYASRQLEKVSLFQVFQEKINANSVIYPGSFVHLSPAFVFPNVVLIDANQNAKRYFESADYKSLIDRNKRYPQKSSFQFFGQDYKTIIDSLVGQFDLILSFYAGYISGPCKSYIRQGGYLLVNDSHGDAGLANLDPDYQLVATINESMNEYEWNELNLNKYFTPKKPLPISMDYLLSFGKGLQYQEMASYYLFQYLGS